MFFLKKKKQNGILSGETSHVQTKETFNQELMKIEHCSEVTLCLNRTSDAYYTHFF